jgi:hypothetical protein
MREGGRRGTRLTANKIAFWFCNLTASLLTHLHSIVKEGRRSYLHIAIIFNFTPKYLGIGELPVMTYLIFRIP